jgi:hypothetical protein
MYVLFANAMTMKWWRRMHARQNTAFWLARDEESRDGHVSLQCVGSEVSVRHCEQN